MARSMPILSGIAALGLTACAAIPDVGPAPAPRDGASLASTQSFAAPQAAWPVEGWWRAYGDPQLDALMAEALAGSPSLAQAQARLRVAHAQAQQARGATLPSLNANGQAAEVKQSYNAGFPRQFVPQGYNDTGRASLDLTFDLDLFGRNRAALAAATSEARAAEVDAAQARLVLTTGIASAYGDLARLFSDRDAGAQALANREATVKLVGQRVDNGAANGGELSQAEAGAAAARQELTALDEQIALARHQLAALAGAGPDRGLTLTRPTATGRGDNGLPANLGADLLGRRPDLQAARLRAEAASRRIDVARAGFYPNINLAAFIGVQSLGLNMLTRSGSDIGQGALAFSLPIFQGGGLRGAYRGARAEYDAAVSAYDQTLVQALQQVADAAASRQALQSRLTDAREARAKSEDAYRIARLRYEGGLDPFVNVLTAEDRAIAQRRAATDLEARALSLDAALVRALGGGFAAS